MSVIDQGGMTPLHLAASLGLKEIVEILIQNRADIDGVTVATGETALHLATAGSHHSTVQFLLDHGASVNKQNNEGKTSLMYAARNNHVQILKTLLCYGARRGMSDIRGNTALLLHCNNVTLVPAMLDMLATSTVIDMVNWDGWWPLLAVVSGNHHNKLESLTCLLRAGADVNLVTSLGYSCLHTSLHYTHWDVARLLVRAGAEVTRPDYLGNTPLTVALLHGNVDMANILLAAGAPCHIPLTHLPALSDETRRWIKLHNGKAKSLKEISRLAVRNICVKKLETFLVQAEIPKTLKQYVYFLLE